MSFHGYIQMYDVYYDDLFKHVMLKSLYSITKEEITNPKNQPKKT